MFRRRVWLVALAATAFAAVAHADLSSSTSPMFGGGSRLSSTSALGFSPRVPVSALARPAAWFDPSRLQIASSVSVGSGFGHGVNALQVTSVGYRFAAPVWMNVNIGNAWGPANASKNGSSLFLEGLEIGARPFANLQIQFSYRDFRSPLQVPNDYRGFGW